uniref:AAR2 C-terminal domain-containing protein n=1 Tax=Parascaris equorum TaxID=6256 RepID=A0A914R7M9_PAREQ
MKIKSNLGMSTSRVDREHPTRFRFADENGLPIMHIKQGFKIRFTQLEPPLNFFPIRLTYWYNIIAIRQFVEYFSIYVFQVYEGFEQWKRLIHLLCSCKKAIATYPKCPKDFFVDIVSRDNFLTTTLSRLFVNIEGFSHISVKSSLLYPRYLWKFASG